MKFSFQAETCNTLILKLTIHIILWMYILVFRAGNKYYTSFE